MNDILKQEYEQDLNNLILRIFDVLNENLIEKKNKNILNINGVRLEFLDAPHVKLGDNNWSDDEVAIYMFYYDNGHKFLKIGKATESSKSRFISQHYNLRGANSTLARSIYFDEPYKYNEKGLIRYDEFQEEKIHNLKFKYDESKCKFNSEDNYGIDNWIYQNCTRIHIKFKISMFNGDHILLARTLNVIETVLHCIYLPTYESK